MKQLKYLYAVPILISMLAAIALIWFFFPNPMYARAALTVLLPLAILALGFRLITYHRIQIIRKQLHQILQTLEEFDVDEPQKIAFESSPFPVFNELNEYLIELIDRIRTNYQANKQFTQNATHELQTPLAIIKGYVELLLQSPNIGEKEIESLALVLQNTNRLAKLNSALILLSKIEHQQFIDTESVNFIEVIDEMLANFKDLIQMRKLEIRRKVNGKFEFEMSQTLSEILITNLLQNAIRHNLEEGFIKVQINDQSILISNPGYHLEVEPTTLFKRFKRHSEVDESLGLGLSIVQRICEQSGLRVSYQFDGELHTLEIAKQIPAIS